MKTITLITVALLLSKESHGLSSSRFSDKSPSTTSIVQNWFTESSQSDSTTIPPSSISSSGLFYTSEFERRRLSTEEYRSSAIRWDEDCRSLFDGYETKVLRCSSIDDGTSGRFNVRWRATWFASNTVWLSRVAATMKWKVTRATVDPTRISTFSYAAIFRMLGDAVRLGNITLPISAVEGSTVVTIDSSSGLCTSIEETVDLVGEADRGRLLNRKVAQDLAEWLDVSRRLDRTDPEDWASRVRSRVLAGVPNALPLDLDPNEDEAEGALALVLFGTICAAALVGSYYMLGLGNSGAAWDWSADAPVRHGRIDSGGDFIIFF